LSLGKISAIAQPHRKWDGDMEQTIIQEASSTLSVIMSNANLDTTNVAQIKVLMACTVLLARARQQVDLLSA
jgi:hypothetical protein